MLYPLLLVSALSLLALIPLLQPHFFASSDGLYHVYRAIEIGSCLEDGAWVCRWAPHQFLGYGTPLFNFYSPFIYYITNVFHSLGLDWVNASRAMTALFLVFSAVSAYAYAAEFLSKPAAVLVSVAYVYVPYHLVNAYYRGDLPEFAAMAWFPAILWAFSRLARPMRRRVDWAFLPLAALSYAGLIVTHNLSAYIYTGVLVVYCLWLLLVNRLERNYGSLLALLGPAGRLLGATALAFGLSAFLSMPALLEKDLVTLEGLLYVSHADHFPTLEQILPNSIVHAYGIIFPDSPVYAYKMGLVQVLMGGLGALAAFGLWKRFGWRARGEAVISVALFGLAFYFTQPPSLWLWDSIPLLPHAQFPWRFLLLMALPTSLMVGYLVDLGGTRWRLWVAAPLVGFVLLTNLLGLKPIMANTTTGEVDLRSSVEFELLYHLMGTTVAGEYIPRTVKERPFVNDLALAWTLGGEPPVVHPVASDPHLKVEQLERRPTSASYRVTAERPGQAVFNIVHFPEWRAWLDGAPVPARPNDPQGLIAVEVPTGQHTVRLAFENTPLRTRSEWFSLACLAVTLVLLALALGRPRLPSPPAPRLTRRGVLAGLPFLLVAASLPLGAVVFARGYLPPPVAQHPLKIDLGNTIELVGYDLAQQGRPVQPHEPVQAGTTLDLAIYWRSLDGGARVESARVYARLSNIDEQQWSHALEVSRSLLADGRVYRSLVKLAVPPGQPPGAYQIDIGAIGRDDRPYPVKNMELVELLPTQGSVRLGPLLVRSDSREAAALRLPASINFQNALRLESYDLSRGVGDRRLFPEPATATVGGPLQAAAGDTLQVDLLWRSLRDRPGHYQMSASLVDDQGFKWAVRDAEPADGMYPTWMWRADQPIRDQLRMAVPAETPPGRYHLALRVLEDGQPLSVLDANGNPAGGQADLVQVALTRSEIPVRERELRGVTNRERVKVNDDLEIVAADYGRSELRPGESTDVALVWRALRDVQRDYAVRLSLVAANGTVLGQTEALRPAGELNPTSDWEARDYFRGQYRLVARPNARPGTARLTVELVDRTSGQAAARSARLSDVKVLERLVEQAGDDVDHHLDLQFGASVRLLGFELDPDALAPRGRASSGEPLAVRLLWGADGEPGKAYTVFTQLLDAEGKLVAQHDGPPAGGKRPTTGWLAGDRVSDEHRIELPGNLPPGEYRLIVGLYDASGERLKLANGENHAVLGTIRLEK